MGVSILHLDLDLPSTFRVFQLIAPQQGIALQPTEASPLNNRQISNQLHLDVEQLLQLTGKAHRHNMERPSSLSGRSHSTATRYRTPPSTKRRISTQLRLEIELLLELQYQFPLVCLKELSHSFRTAYDPTLPYLLPG
jgi:hypothetical protein